MMLLNMHLFSFARSFITVFLKWALLTLMACCFQIRYTILDEADQMLDMGFEEDMETILGQAPPERQV